MQPKQSFLIDNIPSVVPSTSSSPIDSRNVSTSNSNFGSPPPTKLPSSPGHERQPSVQLKIEAAGGPPPSLFRVSLFSLMFTIPHWVFSTSKQNRSNWRNKFSANFQYILAQFVVLVSRISPVVQFFSTILLLTYLVQFSGDVTRDFFSLTPGEIISPGQWYHTVLSLWLHVFLEIRWYMVVVDLLVLSFTGTLIEPLWGYKEVSGLIKLLNLYLHPLFAGCPFLFVHFHPLWPVHSDPLHFVVRCHDGWQLFVRCSNSRVHAFLRCRDSYSQTVATTIHPRGHCFGKTQEWSPFVDCLW